MRRQRPHEVAYLLRREQRHRWCGTKERPRAALGLDRDPAVRARCQVRLQHARLGTRQLALDESEQLELCRVIGHCQFDSATG